MATKHFFQVSINGMRGTQLFAGSYDACLRFIAANHGTDAVATSLTKKGTLSNLFTNAARRRITLCKTAECHGWEHITMADGTVYTLWHVTPGQARYFVAAQATDRRTFTYKVGRYKHTFSLDWLDAMIERMDAEAEANGGRRYYKRVFWANLRTAIKFQLAPAVGVFFYYDDAYEAYLYNNDVAAASNLERETCHALREYGYACKNARDKAFMRGQRWHQ